MPREGAYGTNVEFGARGDNAEGVQMFDGMIPFVTRKDCM